VVRTARLNGLVMKKPALSLTERTSFSSRSVTEPVTRITSVFGRTVLMRGSVESRPCPGMRTSNDRHVSNGSAGIA